MALRGGARLIMCRILAFFCCFDRAHPATPHTGSGGAGLFAPGWMGMRTANQTQHPLPSGTILISTDPRPSRRPTRTASSSSRTTCGGACVRPLVCDVSVALPGAAVLSCACCVHMPSTPSLLLIPPNAAAVSRVVQASVEQRQLRRLVVAAAECPRHHPGYRADVVQARFTANSVCQPRPGVGQRRQHDLSQGEGGLCVTDDAAAACRLSKAPCRTGGSASKTATCPRALCRTHCAAIRRAPATAMVAAPRGRPQTARGPWTCCWSTAATRCAAAAHGGCNGTKGPPRRQRRSPTHQDLPLAAARVAAHHYAARQHLAPLAPAVLWPEELVCASATGAGFGHWRFGIQRPVRAAADGQGW